MPGTFRIGKIAGIDIDIHVSWIIILVLLTVSLATGWFPQLYSRWSTASYWLIALLSSLLLFVSVLLHELAHSLVARRRGLPVKSITLFIFGGVSNIEREPMSPGSEFQMDATFPNVYLVSERQRNCIAGLRLREITVGRHYARDRGFFS